MVARHYVGAVVAGSQLKHEPPPEGGYRYWRIEFLANQENNAASYFGMSKVEMADEIGGADIIARDQYLSRSAGSTSEGNESFLNAFRPGNPGQYTAVVRRGTGTYPWIQWNFGQGNEKTLEEVRISTRYEYQNQYPAAFRVLASNDLTTWLTMWQANPVADPNFVWFYGRMHSFPKGFVKPAAPPRDAPHKFWRVRGMTYHDVKYWAMSRGSFFPTADMAARNSMTGAVPTISQLREGSAANAFGTTTAYAVLASNNRRSAYEVEFAVPVEVRAFSMYSRNGYGGQAVKSFAIDYSDDGINYYTAWEVIDTPAWVDNEFRAFVDPAFL